MFAMHETSEGVTFAVKIHPRAKKNAIGGELGDVLKVSLTAPPDRWEGQRRLHRILRKTFEATALFRYHCSGQASRQKVIRVSGLSAEEVRRRVGI
jgi:uncharacterized protein (TIGR00251 family)